MIEGQVMLLEDATALLLIHFTYRSPPGTMRAQGIRLGPELPDVWRIACAPHLTHFHASGKRPFVWQRTNETRAVTCPLCKETDIFKEASAQLVQALARGRRSV